MATIQAESNFAYHGLQTDSLAHGDAVKYIIKEYLEGINFDRSLPATRDLELESAVLTYFKSLNLGKKMEASVQKVLKLSATLAHRSYNSLPFENKVLCAVQFLYMFLVDDIAEEFMEDLRYFGQNFTLNNGHRHPLLHNFDKHLRYLARFYGPYSHSVIIKSLFDYVNGRIIEHQMEQTNFKALSDSRLMPMFLRTKVGAAEILISMLWPRALFPEEEYLIQYFPAIQELVLFVDFTNDILSYYKEFCIHDEKGNFVANFAQTHGMSHLDVLKHLASYTPQVIQSVYKTFRDKEDLLKSVQNFVNGWVMLCTAHRRYHLVELFGDEGYLQPYDDES
ncbi:hypothetical protein FQN54_009266 [Arachnomyces sp. PD_36]|nr:hypothetical protein FQN54_009266 [Arachnomyces sp. PD_36]